MRKGLARVAVQREEEHVVPVVEDRLGPVAVMEVDVEDGDTSRAAVEEGLGGRRRRC